MLTASVTAVFEILAPEVVAPFFFCALTMWIQEITPVLLLAVTVLDPKVCIHVWDSPVQAVIARCWCLYSVREKASDVSDSIIRVAQSKPQKPEKDSSPNVKMQIAKVKLGVEFFLQVMKKGQGFIKQGMWWLIQAERNCTWSFDKVCR